MPGTEEEPSWQEMGPEGVWRGRLLGPVAPAEVFAVLCEERESCRGLGAKVILLQHTSGKDRLGHSLRRSRVPGREASVVTRMKKGSG